MVWQAKLWKNRRKCRNRTDITTWFGGQYDRVGFAKLISFGPDKKNSTNRALARAYIDCVLGIALS